MGPPAREFDSFYLSPVSGLAPLGVEVAWAGHSTGRRFGVRPSVAVEAWGRHWTDVSTSTVWGRELGARVEPRLAVRWIATPGRLWTRPFRVNLTVDAGIGGAFVLFADGPLGFGAFSPTFAIRPALHVGHYEPAFVALDLRAGFHGQLEGCYPGRDHCPDIRLNPGGTSVGLVIGHAL